MKALKILNQFLGICLFVCGLVVASEDTYVVGHEAVFNRFMKGVLVYKPNLENNEGRVNIPIASLADPLAGTFDLSGFGDIGNSISIHTGYKKTRSATNTNKVEIWICPKFLVERELDREASQFLPIIGQWESPIAYFWTWGNHDVAVDNYDYLLTSDVCNNNDLTLFKKWGLAVTTGKVEGPWDLCDSHFHFEF